MLDMEEGLPPGFRFHPTDEELITYYLTRKVLDFGFVAKAIADVDLNKCEPWDLPAKANMGEKEWYFFSVRDRKYPTGLRTNRATDAGYWKTTGKDKEIFHGDVLVGMKKTLVFYRGRAPKGEKTNWVMHEYRLQTKFPYKPSKEEWVVCRVFKKSSIGKKPLHNMTTTSSSLPSPLGSPCNTPSITELGELDASILNTMAANPSASFSSMQTNESSTNANSHRMGMDMNLQYMNWMLPWPASLMGSGLISATPAAPSKGPGSFSGYQATNHNVSNMSSFLVQGVDHGFLASSSKEQQHENESIWRGY